jgi:Methyltransferase domain
VGLDPRYVRRLRWISKARAVHNVGAPIQRNLTYVLFDPEPANCTYELTNEPELAAWVAELCAVEPERVLALLRDAHRDSILVERLTVATAGHWWWTKRTPPFGRRLAWYALARILRPQLVVETGVHDGLGSLLLLRALEQNGDGGRLVSFDINPAAGWLVGEHPQWELRIEPSQPGLESALSGHGPLGLFIHDSLHTYENEYYELRIAAEHLSDRGVLVTDNAHGTRALADLCASLGFDYSEFHEHPRGHFHPGGAMGAGRRPRPVG